MRRTTPLVLAAAALLLAGCGSPQDTGSGGGRAPAPSGTGAPPAGRNAGDCTGHANLTVADQDRSVCVAEGGELRLTLDGTSARPWQPVTASGTGLRAINAGLVLQPGDATAAYRAVAAGTVKLSSSRPRCPEPAAPDQASCEGVEKWTVTVRVG
ncbi:hypothetical protein QWJ26_26645 [Streptomyces sp. CSDS2]|uniref:hypothetical protein n=1 Tax=Streptomyces sp. CSDS2 TaxID=3055051 RepID=UPI0025B0ABA5|nr:hypothetical protein [Streptomyces sp. CSDS2]MDN3263324.1 hypothetical protein [Streptomyces sp. CSDS2]